MLIGYLLLLRILVLEVFVKNKSRTERPRKKCHRQKVMNKMFID